MLKDLTGESIFLYFCLICDQTGCLIAEISALMPVITDMATINKVALYQLLNYTNMKKMFCWLSQSLFLYNRIFPIVILLKLKS